MIALRDYQERAVAELRAHWRERPILMLPTGAGKTVVAASIIQGAVAKGRRVLFLVHRRELVRQAVERLADWEVRSGVIAAGWPTAPAEPVQVASIQTLARRAKPAADVVIVDECQHARSDTWEELLDHYSEASACVLGLSATPYRLDGRGLGRTFGCIVRPVTVRELCELGVLVEPEVYAPPPPDLTGVPIVRGDYDLDALAQRMKDLCGDIVAHWFKHAQGRRTVAFACSVEHSETMVARFVEQGVRAAHLDGSMAHKDRDAVLAQLASGELELVSNCMVLGEGWDLPALECAILARPTASMALHRQQVGRIMRAAAGKGRAIVLDHAGNTVRLGFVTQEVDVKLDDRAKLAGEPPVKTCPGCFRVVPVNCMKCPECGYEFEDIEKKTPPDETDETLVRLTPTSDENRREVYRHLVELASDRGSRLGWARHQFLERYGVWPSAAKPLGLGRSAGEVESVYQCSGYEAKPSQWGEKCGRCFKAGRGHVTHAERVVARYEMEGR